MRGVSLHVTFLSTFLHHCFSLLVVLGQPVATSTPHDLRAPPSVDKPAKTRAAIRPEDGSPKLASRTLVPQSQAVNEEDEEERKNVELEAAIDSGMLLSTQSLGVDYHSKFASRSICWSHEKSKIQKHCVLQSARVPPSATSPGYQYFSCLLVKRSVNSNKLFRAMDCPEGEIQRLINALTIHLDTLKRLRAATTHDELMKIKLNFEEPVTADE